MEKIQTRRRFLKKAGIAAVLSQLPLLGGSSGFSTILSEGVNPQNEFSLLKLEKLLPTYKFPFIDRFSTTSFYSEYTLYNLYGDHAVFSGKFFLKSALKEKGRQFDLFVWRFANNGIKKRDPEFKYFLSGKVQCHADPTFSPEKWNILSRIALTGDGPAYGGTAITNNGMAKNGVVKIKTPGKPIVKSHGPMPLTWKWGLPAVVQNMAENHIPELRFSTLDEFDTIHKNQTLKMRKKISLDCGEGRLVEFRVYELTGHGIIPTVYWVDHMNRTVFVVSGMEACVLDDEIGMFL
jgi:hypothetical protein